ncbi:MAG TPA: glycosyltransferase family 87 protein [Allosphingosinicella sp.]|jgi:hypothetical protein
MSEVQYGWLLKAAKPIALLFLFAAVTAAFVNARHPIEMDYVSYWAAAVLALGGDAAAAYDVAAHKAVELTEVPLNGSMPFPYPPAFLLLLLPFGLLPFSLSAAVWTGTTCAAYLAAARRLLPGSGWIAAAYPAVLVNAVIGQNGFLTAAIFIAGLLCLPRRPFAAGLVLGCLILKPQLGLLLPLAFIAGRDWKAFAGAAVSTLGLSLLGLIAFGPASYAAWIGQMPLYTAIVSDGLVGWYKMASFYASLRLAGAPAEAAWAVHMLAAALAAAGVWTTWRSDCSLAAKGALLAAATTLVSPYLYLYDTLLLIVPIFHLLRAGADRRLIALLWALPMFAVLQNWVWNDTVNLTPFASLAILLLVWRQARLEVAVPESAGAAAPAPAGLPA